MSKTGEQAANQGRMIPAQRSRFETLAIEWGAAFEASPVSPATSCST
jgi:hypothetical protein